MTLVRAALVAAVLSAARAAAAAPQTADPANPAPQDRPRLTIDQLTKVDVTSAAKHAEPVFEAAAAVTIITGDDIRRAGVTSLPEALRLAAGVDVARTDGHTWAISARGFDISTANKMVVMIDGRSVYTPLFSGVFWDVQDVVLDDVDRIEVVRGPGASLWGANAVNGVINIITKRAADTKGTLVQTGGGNELGQVEVQHGGDMGGRASYRVYGKYQYTGAQVFASGQDANDPFQTGQVGTRIDADFGRTSVTVQSDAYSGTIGLFDRADADVAGGNALARVTRTFASGSQLQFQSYYDYTYRRVPLQVAEARQTVDADLQYHVLAGRRHDITAGAGANVSHSRTVESPVLSFDPGAQTIALLNVFAEDTVEIVPQRFYVTGGSKIEHNDYTGIEVQPTGRVRWSPDQRHTIWAAISRAVRIPTRFDTDLLFTGGTSSVLIEGSPDFLSETVVAHEVGYRQKVNRGLAIGVTVFENDYDHLRSQEPTPPTGFPVVLSNLLTASTTGVEFSARLQPSTRWEIRTSYSFLSERFRLKPGSLDPTGGASEANDPANEGFVESLLTLPHHVEVDATVRGVGRLPHPVVPGYAELTLHIGVKPTRTTELAFIGDNLLHASHLEGSTLPNPEAFVRSVFAQITWRY